MTLFKVQKIKTDSMAMDLYSSRSHDLLPEQIVLARISKGKTSAHHRDILRPPILLEMPCRQMKTHSLGSRVHQFFSFSEVKNFVFSPSPNQV